MKINRVSDKMQEVEILSYEVEEEGKFSLVYGLAGKDPWKKGVCYRYNITNLQNIT